MVLASLLQPWALHAAQPIVCGATANPIAAADAANRAIEQHLIVEEQASWNLAIKRDAISYKAFHAPDYVTVTGTGVMDRASSEASAGLPRK